MRPRRSPRSARSCTSTRHRTPWRPRW
jgi:hypothetical protein